MFYFTRFCIHYEGRDPIFWVNDLDLIKRILVTDYNSFNDFAFLSIENQALEINDFGLASKFGEEHK